MLTKRVVGVIELASKYKYGVTSRGVPIYLFRPYDETLSECIVGCSQRDTTRNYIAVVDVEVCQPAAGQKPRGYLYRLIGPVGSHEEEIIGLLAYYCPVVHKKETVAPEPDTHYDDKREEICAETGWTVFHVDPAGCRDIDDAIAWNHEKRQWAITIADAVAFVSAGSPIDTVAQKIGATFYNPAGMVIVPMLPLSISAEEGSLLPGQRRRGVTLFLTDDGPRWALTWTTVAHGFSYEEFSKSAIARECGLQDKEPHQWIADMMTKYNQCAAGLLTEAGLLRVQPVADAEAVRQWLLVAPEMANEAAYYQFPEEGLYNGHAGLGMNRYCHASSPLRRYADLHNQRILKAIIAGEEPISRPDGLDIYLNERTKANRRWSRDMTFLVNVTPGRVHTIDVVWMDETRVWVPAWSRIIRIRHQAFQRHAVLGSTELIDRDSSSISHDAGSPTTGTRGKIDIFCDPTQRNWKRRVLTADHVPPTSAAPALHTAP
jgi:exoribonuclease R